MVYQTAQFDYLFLMNVPIPIYLESGDQLSLITPSISEYHTNEAFRKIEALMLVSIMELQMNPGDYGFVADNYLELFLGAKMTEPDNPLFSELERITGASITKSGITFNGVPLSEEDFMEIRFALLVSTGKMGIDGDIKVAHNEETEISRKMRESEEKINAIKGKGSEGERVTFKDMLLLIVYELNKSLEEMTKLNFFGINELFVIAQLSAGDKIQKIAAGNGALPKNSKYKNIIQ